MSDDVRDLVVQQLERVEPEDNSRKFAEYWFSLPKTGLIPSRSDFNPAGVAPILPFILIHELVSEAEITVRLAGTAITQAYGEEITGRNYLDFVPTERRCRAARVIQLILAQPVGMLVRLNAVSRDGKAMKREAIALPMRDAAGAPRFVFYCVSPVGKGHFSEEPRSSLQIRKASERVFLDIGAGIPEFAD